MNPFRQAGIAVFVVPTRKIPAGAVPRDMPFGMLVVPHVAVGGRTGMAAEIIPSTIEIERLCTVATALWDSLVGFSDL